MPAKASMSKLVENWHTRMALDLRDVRRAED